MASISPIKRLPSTSVLHVKIQTTRELTIRFWLATRLIMLTSLVLGCRVELSEKE